MSSNYAIIVAGGNGSRMGSQTPKQFMLLNGLPVLMHTIRAFNSATTPLTIIVALPESLISTWKELCKQHQFTTPHHIAKGGDSRFSSVKNSLELIKKEHAAPDYIAVHDAARPLVTAQLIDTLFAESVTHKAVVPGVRSIDSVRLTNHSSNHAFPRDQVYLIQTPQVFEAKLLLDCYDTEEDTQFTDDASVVESKKIPITIIEGEYTNIKITYSSDLKLAEFLSKQRN